MAHVETKIEVTGAQICVRRAGSGANLVILGDMLGPIGWAPFMDGLARSFSVIAPEHPGFGGAKIPDWLDTISDLANFYLDFLDAGNLTEVHLLGLGIGGWIAADMATRNAARIATLSLVNAAGIHLRNTPQSDIFLGSEDEVLRELVHDQTIADALIAKFLIAETENIRLQDQEVLARTTWQPRLNDPHLHKWLHRIRTPTHIVWSGNNRLFPAAYGREWQKRIAGSHLSVIPGCGHLAQFEKPEALVQIITTYICGQGA